MPVAESAAEALHTCMAVSYFCEEIMEYDYDELEPVEKLISRMFHEEESGMGMDRPWLDVQAFTSFLRNSPVEVVREVLKFIDGKDLCLCACARELDGDFGEQTDPRTRKLVIAVNDKSVLTWEQLLDYKASYAPRGWTILKSAARLLWVHSRRKRTGKKRKLGDDGNVITHVSRTGEAPDELEDYKWLKNATQSEDFSADFGPTFRSYRACLSGFNDTVVS